MKFSKSSQPLLPSSQECQLLVCGDWGVMFKKCTRETLWIGRVESDEGGGGVTWCGVAALYLRNFKLNCDVFKLTFLPQLLTGALVPLLSRILSSEH